jgi:hypothetical protein
MSNSSARYGNRLAAMGQRLAPSSAFLFTNVLIAVYDESFLILRNVSGN